MAPISPCWKDWGFKNPLDAQKQHLSSIDMLQIISLPSSQQYFVPLKTSTFHGTSSYFQVEMQGLTGTIKFDNQGFRTNFLLDVIELSKEGLVKIGTWNSTEGINFTRTYGEAYTQIVESLMNKTFVVCIILVSFPTY
jgi:hypothetical protein